jgi:hypothetical protein
MKSKRERLSELKKCWKLRDENKYKECLKDVKENRFGNFNINKQKYYNHWRKEFKADKVSIPLLLKAHRFRVFEDLLNSEIEK